MRNLTLRKTSHQVAGWVFVLVLLGTIATVVAPYAWKSVAAEVPQQRGDHVLDVVLAGVGRPGRDQ